jgi:hypothetical protein
MVWVDAGKSGQTHVILRRVGEDWSCVHLDQTSRQLFHTKPIAEPRSHRYSACHILMELGTRVLAAGNHTFCLSPRQGPPDQAFQYKDHFISADEFQWQSQNRRRASDAGQSIQAHKQRGITVHLLSGEGKDAGRPWLSVLLWSS